MRLKNKDEARRYLTEEIKQNELMSKRQKKVCATLNYMKYFLILASTMTGCISVSASASLIGISLGISSFVIGLKICAITVGVKKYKSIIQKKKKKHDEIVMLAKPISNSMELKISKDLTDSFISHYKFILLNNVDKYMIKWKKK